MDYLLLPGGAVFFGVGLLIPVVNTALFVLPVVFRKKIKGGITAGIFYATVFTFILSIVLYFGSYYIGVYLPVFDFNRSGFTVVYQEDTHGGLNGDGQYCLVLDCSDNKEEALKKVEDWKRLPLPKELEIVLYGGEYDGSNYSSSFPDEVEILPITNGYYYFEDRHSESTDKDNPSGLLNRYSYNFDFAIYDADRDILYGIKEDT